MLVHAHDDANHTLLEHAEKFMYTWQPPARVGVCLSASTTFVFACQHQATSILPWSASLDRRSAHGNRQIGHVLEYTKLAPSEVYAQFAEHGFLRISTLLQLLQSDVLVQNCATITGAGA
jgi:hypothetical protein